MNLRSAVNGALRSRFTSAAIVAFVAIGLAALITAFNLADAALWRLPPLNDAGLLVVINSTHKTPNAVERKARWSYPRIREIKLRARSFAYIANFTSTSLTLVGADFTELVPSEFVSPEYFRVVDIRAQRGRLFLASDDSVSASPVVVVSDDYWRSVCSHAPTCSGQR